MAGLEAIPGVEKVEIKPQVHEYRLPGGTGYSSGFVHSSIWASTWLVKEALMTKEG
jgi:hypothetical protein